MDSELELDPLALNSSDLLNSANIEFVVEEEEDSEKKSAENLNEEVGDENIILYVEDNENGDEIPQIEIVESEDDDSTNVEKEIIADGIANNKRANRKRDRQHIESERSPITSSISYQTRSKKPSYNESFLSFVGKRMKTNMLHQNQVTPNSTENSENIRQTDSKSSKAKNHILKKTVPKSNATEKVIQKGTEHQKMRDLSVIVEKNINLIPTRTKKEITPSVTHTDRATVSSKNSSLTCFVSGNKKPLTHGNDNVQNIPARAPVNLTALPVLQPALQGVLPLGVLSVPILEAISKQAAKQNATIVIMPTATSPQITPDSMSPAINAGQHKLPVISKVQTVASSFNNTFGKRKINILSKNNQTTPSPSKKDSTSENISIIVDDGDDNISSTSAFIKSPVKEPEPKFMKPSVAKIKSQLFQITDLQSKNKSDAVKITQANLCYVPGCTIQKGEKVFLFGVPVDKTLMSMWDASINREDKRLENNDIICQKHFSEEDIVFVRDPAEGNAVVKAKPKLKKGAIPCINYHNECCVPKCTNREGKMYKFPFLDPSNLQLWLYMLKSPMLKSLNSFELLKYRICRKHFENECFEKNGELKKTAAPTLCLPEGEVLSNIIKKGPEEFIKVGSNLKCLFSQCDSNPLRENKKVFEFPPFQSRCVKWLEACDRMDLICSHHYQTERLLRVLKVGICEDHFTKHDFSSSRTDRLYPYAIPKAQVENKVGKEPTEKQPVHIPPNESMDCVDLTSLKDFNENATNSKGCVYLNCSVVNESSDVQLFPFPVNPPSRFRLWLEACGYKDVKNVECNSNFKICSKHFSSVMFAKLNNRLILKSHAIPIFSFDSISINDKSEKNKLYLKVRNISEDIDRSSTEIHFCAVSNCSQAYPKNSYRGMQHAFPDLQTELHRFKLWLKLISNEALTDFTHKYIGETYVVCEKHFEAFFYSDGQTKTGPLATVAVPTLNLNSDIKWLFTTEFYKKEIKTFLRQKICIGNYDIQWLPSDLKDTSEPKNVCVLEKDGLRFPGIGFKLAMDINDPSKIKQKYPYDVYKYQRATYQMMEDIELGESLQIHTAIIINDDDEMERRILQELLDKRKKNMTSS